MNTTSNKRAYKVTINLTEQQAEAVQLLAQHERRSVSELLYLIVSDYLDTTDLKYKPISRYIMGEGVEIETLTEEQIKRYNERQARGSK